jgi:hypothetical protein
MYVPHLHVTLFIRAFAYPRFYFCVIRRINVQFGATAEVNAHAQGVVRAASLTRSTISDITSFPILRRAQFPLSEFPVLHVFHIRNDFKKYSSRV